jgi:hypothetical protein
MDQGGGVVIIFESISHEECESRKVVFVPGLFMDLLMTSQLYPSCLWLETGVGLDSSDQAGF